jgi:hypothetical protein
MAVIAMRTGKFHVWGLGRNDANIVTGGSALAHGPTWVSHLLDC